VRKPSLILRLPRVAWLAAALATALAVAVAARAGAAPSPGYASHSLVSDQAGMADRVDPNLVNAWGLASRLDTPWWVANNATSQATVYTADGNAFARSGSPLVVGVPASPTGVVANSGASFAISAGGASAPALSCSEPRRGRSSPGTRPFPPARPSSPWIGPPQARSTRGWHSAVTGCTRPISTMAAWTCSTAASSRSAGRARSSTGRSRAGSRPSGFRLGSRILVTFAKQDARGEDDVHGPGLGFVDAFDRNGRLLARVARRGELNAPWGIADAPRTFGRFGGDLLIGNFGDGSINAFRQRPGGAFTPAGELPTAAGRGLVIDGLWALEFGHGAANNGPANTLFFTAGPGDEAHGLFGTITAG
jgi:hypothetical protein